MSIHFWSVNRPASTSTKQSNSSLRHHQSISPALSGCAALMATKPQL